MFLKSQSGDSTYFALDGMPSFVTLMIPREQSVDS